MTLLSGGQLLDRLKKGEVIQDGWWDSERLRPAGYDLRIAADRLTVNNKAFAVDEFYDGALKLHPGDVAYVSSYERFCVPWDLAANIGVRFRFAKRGLLVFTGLLVDPGFGLKKAPNGGWDAYPDHRLHFFVANTGTEPIDVTLGQEGVSVLSLQFFQIKLAEDEVLSRYASRLPRQANQGQLPTVAGEGGAALAFFHSLRDLEKRFDEEIPAIRREISTQATDLKRTQSATDNIVVFGVYLVAVTLLGVTAAVLVGLLGSNGAEAVVDNVNRLETQGPGQIVVILALLVLVGFALYQVPRAASKEFAHQWNRRRRSPARAQDE
jgi:deoxycytidine triphosphate deaminase